MSRRGATLKPLCILSGRHAADFFDVEKCPILYRSPRIAIRRKIFLGWVYVLGVCDELHRRIASPASVTDALSKPPQMKTNNSVLLARIEEYRPATATR